MIGWVQDFSTLLIFLICAICTFNLLFARRITAHNHEPIEEKISILIPLRNEAENVAGVIESLLDQKNLSNFEIIALDDGSTDSTNAILRGFSHPKLRYMNGKELPTGWLGKNFACHQLSLESNGEILVFVDADVRLHPLAVNTSIRAMKKWKWDFISPYPRQIAISFVERLAQPLLQWSWFSTLPLRLAERLKRPSMMVANGQFLLVTQGAYRKSGGHEAVKSEVLDDLELARSLIKGGFKGHVAEASSIAECRMYSDTRELFEGYSKSQWRAFGNPLGAIIVSTLLFLTSIYPLISGLSGNIEGWYSYFAVVCTRILVGVKTRSTLSTAFLHPISAGLWIFLIFLSWYRKWNGTLKWRGRTV
jgi:glycosyltransferase involved in cell wall biosynthesis